VGGQRHTPAALPPGKTPCPLYRRLGGPQGWSGQVRKISPPPGFDTRTVQPNLITRMEIYYPATYEKLNFQSGKMLRNYKSIRRHLLRKWNRKRMTGGVVRFIKTLARICGNKMLTRCNRGFYCRSYCLLNMFRAPLCPSAGDQEYYTVVAVCGISYCGFKVAGLLCSWGLCVRFAGCCSILQTRHITLSSTPDQQLENHSTKHHRQQPLYNTLELLMMGIVVPETCWASNKICNKYLCCI